LRKQIPQSYHGALGISGDPDAEIEDESEYTPAEAMKRTKERIMTANILRGLEGKPPLDSAMEEQILKANLGLSFGAVEDMDIEAWRRTNKFQTDEDGVAVDPEEQVEANQAFLSETLKMMDMGSLDDFVEKNPLLTQFDREVSQMRGEGYTEDRIADYVLDKMSRERQAIIMGEGYLDEEFSYDNYDEEDIERMERAAANEATQLDWMMRYQFGRPPTTEENRFYMAQVFFTGPEQDRIDIDRYSAPRRENVTTDERYIQRQTTESGIVDAATGTDFLERLGEHVP
jgi:hypothetical protein